MVVSKLKVMLAAFAAVALAGMAACAPTQPGEPRSEAGAFVDDAATTARVKTAIATDVGAKTAGQVSVNTNRGVVQLSGFVDSEDQINRAVSAAKQVSGVRTVQNDLRVKSPAAGS
jgi:hyperosmotically inducible periplasmic protein